MLHVTLVFMFNASQYEIIRVYMALHVHYACDSFGFDVSKWSFIFMAQRGIPFPQVQTIYIYLYIYACRSM